VKITRLNSYLNSINFQQEYTYATNTSLSKFEILAFFEWDSAMNTPLLTKEGLGVVNAEDITKIRTFWKEIWVLTNETWTPIEKISSIQTAKKLDLAIDTDNYVAHFNDTITKTLTGSQLYNWLLFVNKSAPKKCDEWWIKVPWNVEFMTNDFCVAQYEMSYETTNELNTALDRNTDSYDSSKTDIVSQRWGYPITEINQWEAINACKTIWWHLITNNEWMTIARNIEQQSVNWSSWIVWSWWIYRWVTNNPTYPWWEEFWCNWKQDLINYAWITWSDCDWTNRNRLKLSNWEYVYDLSWNVFEHVNWANTVDWSSSNTFKWNICNTITAWFHSFTENSENDSSPQCNFIDGFSYNEYWPSIIWLNSSNWIWRVRSYDLNDTKDDRVITRWSSWSYWYHWWVFTFGVTRDISKWYKTAGFRCVK